MFAFAPATWAAANPILPKSDRLRTPAHVLAALFEQLGLPAEDASLEQFMR
jgi:hypothetical protein